MMSAHPAVLRELVERYEHLRAQSPDVLAEPRIRDLLRDTAYTLCVTTGTREIGAALAAARALLAEAEVDAVEAAGVERTGTTGAGPALGAAA
jgi:hypothetical protein